MLHPCYQLLPSFKLVSKKKLRFQPRKLHLRCFLFTSDMSRHFSSFLDILHHPRRMGEHKISMMHTAPQPKAYPMTLRQWSHRHFQIECQELRKVLESPKVTQVEIYPEICALFHIAQVAEPSSISTYEVGKNLLAPTWPWTNPFPKIPIQQPRHRPSIGPSAYVGPQQERGCTGNASDKKTQEEVPHIPKTTALRNIRHHQTASQEKNWNVHFITSPYFSHFQRKRSSRRSSQRTVGSHTSQC